MDKELFDIETSKKEQMSFWAKNGSNGEIYVESCKQNEQRGIITMTYVMIRGIRSQKAINSACGNCIQIYSELF